MDLKALETQVSLNQKWMQQDTYTTKRLYSPTKSEYYTRSSKGVVEETHQSIYYRAPI